MYKNLELKKEKIRRFLRKNSKATYRDIKEKLKMKVERVYSGGMKEAFEDARIKLPRTFERKSKEEKRKILIEYIKKHPRVGGHTIRKETKINFFTIFKKTENIFEAAGIDYPRGDSYKKSISEKKENLIRILRENPEMTIQELIKVVKTNPYRFFSKIDDLYKEANIKKISGHEKRKRKITRKIIRFIKQNPWATQREINNACKTHVQQIFNKGIFEAYKRAGIEFPYERLKLYGTALKHIKQRAKTFEEEIALTLSGFGNVNRLVKTTRGVADIIFERKGRKVVVEIKDYQAKDISISQIKQLNIYLDDCNCDLGFLICHKKPRKDKFLIGKNKIFILEESDLKNIPNIIKGL